MLHIDPSETPPRDFYQYLIGAVAPRPIAFISTSGNDGKPNLAPYSFFNAFSGTPPIVAFAAARRRGPVNEKDTLNNILESGELVINSVSYDISRQMALTSIEFPPGADEFEKAGFTKLPSEKVRPFRVAESHIQMECKVEQIIPFHQDESGSSLVICRVLLMHIDPAILNEQGRIDPHKADLMGRLGRQYYVRASGNAIMELAQDTKSPVIGFDGLPKKIRESNVLTGNQLAQLAALAALPEVNDAEAIVDGNQELMGILKENDQAKLHTVIAGFIEKQDLLQASALVVLGSR